MPLTAIAQDNGQPPPTAQPAPQDQAAQQAPLATPEQLDQMLAPIALYPDQLLGQILMASTYPLEVVQADRWVKDPNNAALKDDQLANALAQVDWDPSVKALVPFPQILALMDERLDWTQNLGNAFLAQQGDVMDSIQRLRRQAQAAGNLQSTAQQTVTPTDGVITITPTNPTVAYGVWPYPAYPPIYLPPPPGFYVGPAIVSGIGFSIGFGIIGALWGWDSWDWGHHRLHVDANRYNVINNYFIQHDRRPALRSDNWTHDPTHRRGVVYANPQVQARFRNAPAGTAAARRDFRGFDRSAPAARPAAAPARPPAAARPAVPPSTQRPASASPQPAARPQAQRPAAPAQRPAAAPAARPAPSRQRPPERAAPTVQRTPAPAFQGFGGGNVRAESARGRASLSAPVSRAPAAPRPAAAPHPAAPHPAARPAPAGRGGGAPGEEKHR